MISGPISACNSASVNIATAIPLVPYGFTTRCSRIDSTFCQTILLSLFSIAIDTIKLHDTTVLVSPISTDAETLFSIFICTQATTLALF